MSEQVKGIDWAEEGKDFTAASPAKMSDKECEEWRQVMAIVENAKADCAKRLAEMKSPDWRISEEEALNEAIEALSTLAQNEEYKRVYPRWDMDCLLRDAALAFFCERRENIQ